MNSSSASLYLAEGAPSSYAVGDTLHWHIDLSTAYPRGVFCSRVQARLFPAIPDQGEVALSDHETDREDRQPVGETAPVSHSPPPPPRRRRSTSFWSYVRPERDHMLNASSRPVSARLMVFDANDPDGYLEHFDPIMTSTPDPLEIEVGSEYKIVLPLLQAYFDDLPLESDIFQLGLDCVPLPNMNTPSDSEDTPTRSRLLATSEPFKLIRARPTSVRRTLMNALGIKYPKASSLKGSVKVTFPVSTPKIVDISPVAHFSDEQLNCKLSSRFPAVPIRAGQDVYDRDEFISYLRNTYFNTPLPLKDLPLVCPNGVPLNKVCLDRQHFFKLQKYAETRLTDVLTSRICDRQDQLATVNLATKSLYAVDLGLDDTHQRDKLAKVVLIQGTNGALTTLCKQIRMFVRVAQRGLRSIFVPKTVRERTIDAAIGAFSLALFQVGVFQSSVLAQLVQSVREYTGPWMFWSVSAPGEEAKVVIARLASFLVFHYVLWVLHSPDWAEMDDESVDMRQMLEKFLEKMSHLPAPSAEASAQMYDM